MPTAPLDTLEMVLNAARVRLLDAIAGLAGDVLTDTAPFTLVYAKNAWRRFQELLVNYGVNWLKPEKILSSVPAVVGGDPGIQVYINWANYFDGSTTQAAPVLPQDLIAPLLLWERAHAGAGSFYPMDRLDNGLPAVPKIALNKSWEWRNGAIYMPGATVITDIRIRYAGSFADFVAPGTTAFTAQYVPILRALNPFAWFICSEVAKARGDTDSQSFDIAAQNATKFVFDLDPMQAKNIGNDAEYGKMTDRYSPTQGPAGPRGPQNGTA